MTKPPKRRGALQHIYAILRSVKRPVKKACIMIEANIGHKTLIKFWPLLLERGMVKEVPYVSDRGKQMSKITPYLYVITEDGKALINLFEQIYDILDWSL